MADQIHRVLTQRQLTEMLIKHFDIHEGLWAIAVEFRMGVMLAGPSRDEQMPSAMVSIGDIGIQQAEPESPIAVDAAVVNPSAESTKKSKPKRPTTTS